jgi:hypothetical protein
MIVEPKGRKRERKEERERKREKWRERGEGRERETKEGRERERASKTIFLSARYFFSVLFYVK